MKEQAHIIRDEVLDSSERLRRDFDTLTLAVARTSNEYFHSNSLLWAKVLKKHKDAIQDGNTGLLDNFDFEEFYTGNFISEQVEAFLSIMRRSGTMDLHLLTGKYSMNEKAKQSIISGIGEELVPFNREIGILASTIDDHLGIK